MIKRAFLFFLISVALTSCVGFQPVPSSELEAKNLVGAWRSSDSTLNIYCSGGLNYEIHGYIPVIGPTNSSCFGCMVSEIQSDQLILGPMVKTKFKISRWPYKEGNDIKMVAEDTTWTRESTKACP